MAKSKRAFWKNFLPLIIAFCGAIIFFTGYNHYIVDRSLANLKFSLEQLKVVGDIKDAKRIKDILDDTVLMEITKTAMDGASVAKIELSSHIIGKTTTISQLKDARYFLEDVIKKKEGQRNPILLFLDNIISKVIPQERKENISAVKKQIKVLENTLSASKKPEQLQDGYLQIVRLALRAKDLDSGLSYVKKVLKIDPESAYAQKANFYLALLYKLQGKDEEAAEIFNKLREKLPKELSDISFYEEGASLYRLGRIEDAIGVFDEAFAKNPSSEVSQLGKFQSVYITQSDLKDDERAFQSFKDLLEMAPQTRLEEIGYAVFSGTTKKYREEGFALLNEGYKLSDEAKFKEALEKFDSAIKYYPKDGLSYSGKALAYYFLKVPEDALLLARTAMEVSPENPEVIANVGYLYRNLGVLDKAIWQYEKAVELFPKSYILHYNLGTLYIIQDVFSKGMTHLTDSIRINPRFPYSRNNLGYILWKEGRFREAKGQLEKAVSLRPDFLEAHYNLGVVFYNMGNFEESLKEFNRVQEIHAAYRKTKTFIAEIKKARGY